jgi:hypothetical protein
MDPSLRDCQTAEGILLWQFFVLLQLGRGCKNFSVLYVKNMQHREAILSLSLFLREEVKGKNCIAAYGTKHFQTKHRGE